MSPAEQFEDDGLVMLAAQIRQLWWMRDGLCLEHLDVEFFPGPGQSAEPAREVCRRCAVRVECVEFAIDNGIVDGIWGGVSGAQCPARAPG